VLLWSVTRIRRRLLVVNGTKTGFAGCWGRSGRDSAAPRFRPGACLAPDALVRLHRAQPPRRCLQRWPFGERRPTPQFAANASARGYRISAALKICIVAALFLAISMRSIHAQQPQNSTSAGRTVPTFEALRHTQMQLPGLFTAWCGSNDKFIVYAGQSVEIRDTQSKLTTLTGLLPAAMQCSENDDRVAAVDYLKASVREIDARRGTDRILAFFEKNPRSDPHVSFSADFGTVVSDRALIFSSDASVLRYVKTSPDDDKYVREIKVSDMASSFYKVTASHIYVYDMDNKKIGGGPVPEGFFFRRGWFDESENLILFLGSDDDESGDGFIFACAIKTWNCRQALKGVVNVSFAKGLLGVVSSVDRRPRTADDGDSEVLPRRYAVEVKDREMKTLIRQEFNSADRPRMRAEIATSGKKIILLWHDRTRCPQAGLCETGIIVDLGWRLK